MKYVTLFAISANPLNRLTIMTTIVGVCVRMAAVNYNNPGENVNIGRKPKQLEHVKVSALSRISNTHGWRIPVLSKRAWYSHWVVSPPFRRSRFIHIVYWTKLGYFDWYVFTIAGHVLLIRFFLYKYFINERGLARQRCDVTWPSPSDFPVKVRSADPKTPQTDALI